MLVSQCGVVCGVSLAQTTHGESIKPCFALLGSWFPGQGRKAPMKCPSVTKTFGPKAASTQGQLRDGGLSHQDQKSNLNVLYKSHGPPCA